MNSSAASGSRVITLTTDFGYRGPFVGQMKGVIASINPTAVILDITHDISPFSVEEGAYIIGLCYQYYPLGSIHVGVVDPGVGSRRPAVIVAAAGHVFVGPDNGLFTVALRRDRNAQAVEIVETRYLVGEASPTFQGRDVFAPVAAWISLGEPITRFGPVRMGLHELPIPEPLKDATSVIGEVVYVDRFGNATTNIRLEHLDYPFFVRFRNESVIPLSFYAEATDDALHCVVNSSGQLELFVNRGNAASTLSISKGERVIVSFQQP